MTYADIAALDQAAADVDSIGTSLEEATLAALTPTSTMLPAGADEISTAIAALFNSHATEFQQIAALAQRFHARFGQLLGHAADAYQCTEQAAEQMLRDAVAEIEQPFTSLLGAAPTPVPPPVPTNSDVGLILGGTNKPFAQQFLAAGPMYMPEKLSYLLYTPEQAWPLTPELGKLTLGQSLSQGTQLLDQAIRTQVAAGNHVTVWTESQSSVVATEDIRSLMAHGSPYTDQLSFVLTGDPSNPNGGFFQRFNGLYAPLLDWNIHNATPSDSPYVTSIYTNQYDAVADFPNYPLNIVSDLNAVLGMAAGQHDCLLPHAGFHELPTSPGYTGDTTYYMSLDPTLPLVQALRLLGLPGTAVADLLQPDLRVLVDLGYASGQYADIPTPAQLFGIPNPQTVLPALATGTVQGLQAFGVDVGLLPQSMFPNAYPYLPSLDLGLNIPTGQPSVTAVSLLTGAERQVMDSLGLIPSCAQ
ncbi:PE-PPE domain-containing protein [Mycobacterium sp.]|uniref:PE-PPE domain-containing protein n=1 Tax=Mycobacterium sp. TaxID=1785 RepID=UPI002C621B81|nr:PE-PPE domain-containing protein [Mycobacterium sp.]HTQ22374.1 PE-PPE domain-containing protein [Mycobacterium sp.]